NAVSPEIKDALHEAAIAARDAEKQERKTEHSLQATRGAKQSEIIRNAKIKGDPQFQQATQIGVEIMEGAKVPLRPYALARKIKERWLKEAATGVKCPPERKLQRWI